MCSFCTVVAHAAYAQKCVTTVFMMESWAPHRALHVAMPKLPMQADGFWHDILAVATRGDAQALAAVLAPWQQAIAALAPPIPTTHPYARLPLCLSEHGEVLLMRWRADAESAIHDHGEAHGMVYAVSGYLRECTVGRNGARGSRRSVAAGEVLAVASGAFHVMEAPEGGISLHVYAPRPSFMRVVDEAAAQVITVRGNHGAWLPVDPACVAEVQPWRT